MEKKTQVNCIFANAAWQQGYERTQCYIVNNFLCLQLYPGIVHLFKKYSQINTHTMKQIFFLLLLLPVTLLGQKFQNGTINFKDGKTLSCLLTPPDSPDDKKIVTKASKDAKSVNYESEDIKSLTVPSGDTTVYEFVREKTRRLTGGLDESWMVVISRGYTTVYTSSTGFKINKKGQLIISGISTGRSTPDFYYMVRRPGEDYATIIGLYSPATIGIDNYFRKASAKYFSDYPALVKRIEKKEFELTDLLIMVAEYDAWKTKSDKKN